MFAIDVTDQPDVDNAIDNTLWLILSEKTIKFDLFFSCFYYFNEVSFIQRSGATEIIKGSLPYAPVYCCWFFIQEINELNVNFNFNLNEQKKTPFCSNIVVIHLAALLWTLNVFFVKKEFCLFFLKKIKIKLFFY